MAGPAFVEHNGYRNELFEIRTTTTVTGDAMTNDLTGTSEQSDDLDAMDAACNLSQLDASLPNAEVDLVVDPKPLRRSERARAKLHHEMAWAGGPDRAFDKASGRKGTRRLVSFF